MSLSATLNNALSGLTASSRRAEVISSNVANATTEGYGRRELDLSAQSLAGKGAGVRIDGVSRRVDAALLGDRRLALAAVENTQVKGDFLKVIETLIGTPEDPGSLAARLSGLSAALIGAASRPDSSARLQAVADSAAALAGHLNTVSDAVQTARMQADHAVASDVDALNGLLRQIDALNADIVSHRTAGRDATALMDQRQQLVDRIAGIVPVREVARDNDQIALFTTGGAILLEGRPSQIGFQPVGVITADMTRASGALSGLTLNGMPLGGSGAGLLGGGSLGAHLEVRDTLGPKAQAGLDAFARDLIARFEAPVVDPTRAPGDAGLFSDRGAALDPLLEVGLAGRIDLNALVDPARGGAVWRLRDGLGAAAPGDVGAATILGAFSAALETAILPASGGFAVAARSSSALAADLLSQISGARQASEETASHGQARLNALTELQLRDGVDTDAEMQNLLLVEQAFGANARVIQTVDDLIQQLIRM